MRSAQTYIEIVHDRGKRKLPLQRVYRNLQKRGFVFGSLCQALLEQRRDDQRG